MHSRKKTSLSRKLRQLLLLSGGLSVGYSLLSALASSQAIAGDLEFSVGSYPTPPNGPVSTSGPAAFLENTSGSVFAAYTPSITMSVSFSNQTYTNGLVIGAGGSANSKAFAPAPVFNKMNTYGSPVDTMFTSTSTSPTGTGISVVDNYAFQMFASVEPLFNAGLATDGTYYYGDVTLTFSRPVTDPVIQMVGMGGNASQSSTVGGVTTTKTHGHTSEFELITPGLTASKLSGSSYLDVTANKITNNAAVITPSCLTGAACGSVKITGTNITTLTFKVYVRGDAQTGAWSTSTASVPTAGNSGDAFLFGGVSVAKPVTVSGTVFDDANGLTDSSINGTGTNAGGLFANLLDGAGKVVASTAVAANGTYSFLAIGAGPYRVSLSTTALTQGTVAPASILPSTWVNTGEGTTLAGDGTVDGSTAITVAAVNVTGVNFGIEKLPDTTNLTPASQTNPGGTATVQVPTLAGTDPEDGALGSGKTFKIVTLPTNGTLTYNGSAITAGQAIANYDPTLLKLDPNDGAITVSFTYAAIDAAGQADPTPATVTMPFTAPITTSSICSAAGGTLGTNLFANNGSFGTGSSTAGTTGSPLPAGQTTYTPVTYGGGAPNDGQYSIVNQLNQTTFNYWFNPVFGHTTGTVNDQMMVVNAAFAAGTFYTETLTVPANQTMNFGFWIVNLPSPNSGGWTAYGGGTAGNPNASGTNIKPDISLVINRIGVDDNNNGVIDEAGEGQVISTSGAVPFTSSPTWNEYGALFNTGNATQVEFRLVNNAPGGAGNDLALDDLIVSPCSLPSGNITGTLYRDQNTNNAYNNGTDPTMPTNIAVNLKNSTGGIVATDYTDASGGYSFTNVPAGSNYTIEVALTDTDIPSGATATANPSGASTTGLQTGITVTANATLSNQNFGFLNPKPQMLLVKRITAINGGTSTVGGDSLASYINEPTNPYDDNTITITTQPTPTDPPKDTDKWPTPNTFLIGGINGGNIKPGNELEYTIYFLSAGDTTAKNVLFCDRVPEEVSFIFNSFGGPSPTGATGTEQGIQLFWNGLATNLSNVSDGDVAQYFPPGIDPKGTYPNVNCRGANTNGAVVVNLGNLPNATAPGLPTTSHGFVRFRGSVK